MTLNRTGSSPRRALFASLLVMAFLFAGASLSAATVNLTSSSMSVAVDNTFPRVVQYTWTASGAVLYGSEDTLSQVLINGTAYTPTVTYTATAADTADYSLAVPSIGVTINVRLQVSGNVLTCTVTGITETSTTKVNTFEIVNQNLVSVRSTQSNAAFAGAKMNTAITGSGDTFTAVTGTPVTDTSSVSYMYALVNTNQLAAGVWSNAVADGDDNDVRIKKQTVSKSGYYRTGLWSASWITKVAGVNYGDDLPTVKVVVTPDANADGAVDWQDGAIAYRAIVNNPVGSEKIPDMVVSRISMNFGSQATNPFAKALDNTKKVWLATDGLGQYVLLKGYASEGHDSGHPDYGNVGYRQGGATDMASLVNIGTANYNAYFGVHVNGTESYPEAAAFNETLMDKTAKGWDWLDPSYYIRKRVDSTSGTRLARLQDLKAKVPNLTFIYWDVWQTNGWDSRKAARETNSQNWALATEFPGDHEYNSIWNHWAVDFNYGGADIKGFSSQIVRFIRNHQKDTWIARHPLLGGAEMNDFEGWQGRTNFDNTMLMTFNTDLPTKYLQHFKIQKWTTNTITFDGNVSVSNATGTRIITKDGKTILNGNIPADVNKVASTGPLSYLLPWDPLTEDKLYHFNKNGGSSTWSLPNSWSGLSIVKLYKLTDLGKVFVQDLTVSGGTITMPSSIVANTAYVVYKTAAPATPNLNWGEGTVVKDPGFESGGLSNWTVAGSGASVVRNSAGQYELNLGNSTGTTVSQTLTGLSQGTWYASVYVSSSSRRATLAVSNYGGAEVSSYTDTSLWTNSIAADSKKGTTLQRMYVFFTVPAGQTTATLSLTAASGSTVVKFDDVRVRLTVPAANPYGTGATYFQQDFENVPDGLFPFIKGVPGGANDPRTHLSELHAPFTQKGWNSKAIDDVLGGNWSMKVYKDDVGLIVQTLPQTLRLVSGRQYQVSFQYEATATGFSFVLGDGTSTVTSTALSAVTTPTTFTSATFTAPASGNGWIGINNPGNAEFVLDNLKVSDLSAPPTIPAVPTGLAASASSSSQINVTWSPVSGATAYDVQLDGTTVYSNVASPFASTGLAASSSHSYKVLAKNSAGSSVWSTAVSASTLASDPVKLSQSQMSAVATSQETAGGNDVAANVLDGNTTTIWHTKWDLSAPLPQSITLTLGGTYQVTQVNVLPRQDGNTNGIITGYTVLASTDGTNFTTVTSGTWSANATEKVVTFAPTSATAIRLTATAGSGGWASASEMNVWGLTGAPTVPAVPTGLTATAASTSQINVTWNSVSGATGYDLVVDGNTVSSVSSPYAHGGLAANSTHSYQVRAKNAAGSSAWSSSANGTTQAASGYSYNFSSGIGGWAVTSGTGTASVSSGSLLLSSPGSTVVVDSNSPSQADGTYQFTVTPQNASGRILAIFRYSGTSSWAGVGYDTGTNWVWVNGADQYGTLTSTGPSLASGTSYTIKVQFTGTTITLWVDGTMIYTGSQPSLPTNAGKLGARGWGGSSVLLNSILLN